MNSNETVPKVDVDIVYEEEHGCPVVDCITGKPANAQHGHLRCGVITDA